VRIVDIGRRLSPGTLARAMGATALTAVCSVAAACGGSSAAAVSSAGPCKPPSSPVITLAAYSNPYDAYGKLTSTFAADWKDSQPV